MEFLKKYNHPKNIRYESFKFALLEANKRNLKTIVETGCARGKIKFIFFSKINWKDGMSTMIFSDYAKFVNGKLTSCDIEKKILKMLKNLLEIMKNLLNLLRMIVLNFYRLLIRI